MTPRIERCRSHGVVNEIAGILSRFRVRQVTGDRYGAGWVRQAFEQAGVRYVESSSDASTAQVTLGVRATGERVVLDLRLVGAESAASWTEVVASLTARHLARPILAVIDGNPGLINARKWKVTSCEESDDRIVPDGR